MITVQERPEDLIIAWRRGPGGALLTHAALSKMVEHVDSETGEISAVTAVGSADIGIPEVVSLIGAQLPALVAERDAAVVAKGQADEEHALALTALNEAHEAALASINEAHVAALGEAAGALETAEAVAATLTGQKAALEADLAQANADKAALQAQIDELTAEPEREAVLRYRFDAALELLPSLTGAEGQTLGEDFDAFKAGLPRTIQKRLNAPEYYRDDEQLNQLATVMVATFQPDNADPGATAQALLDQAFALAPTIP